MAKKEGYENKSGGGLLSGLKNMSPKASDASTRLPVKTTVNQDATRSSVGRATNNLGPRNA